MSKQIYPNSFLIKFERANPDMRLSANERVALSRAFDACQTEAWEAAIRVLETAYPHSGKD